jgi:hypothetical protein
VRLTNCVVASPHEYIYICKAYRGENLSSAWRAAQGQRAPSPQARRHTSAPGRAGGVTAVKTCVSAAAKVWPATRTRRNYIAAKASLHCTDKASNIYSAPLCICRVDLFLLNTFPRQGRRRPTPSFFCRRRRLRNNCLKVPAPSRSYGQRLVLVEGTSPRGLPCHCTDKACNICSTQLHICQVVLLLLSVTPQRS